MSLTEIIFQFQFIMDIMFNQFPLALSYHTQHVLWVYVLVQQTEPKFKVEKMPWKTNRIGQFTWIPRHCIFLTIQTAWNIVPNAIVARLLSIVCGPYETVFDEVNCTFIKSQTRSLYKEHIRVIKHTFIRLKYHWGISTL